MAKPVDPPRLYALADGDALGLDRLPAAVETMAEAGVEWIQIRAKQAADSVLFALVESCLVRLEGSGASLWVNDRPDLAALLPVAGVHLGQDDLPPSAARQVLASRLRPSGATASRLRPSGATASHLRPSGATVSRLRPSGATASHLRPSGATCLIGRSTHNLEQAQEAEADACVDVIAFGPIFATQSKDRPDPEVGLQKLSQVRRRVAKPLVAIGGIGAGNLAQVLAAGADTVAVLGAVCQGDVAANCQRLRSAIKEA